mgnify:CR=1 FL=1
MKTAVVILNWNTEGFLREFLPGLLRSVENVEGAEVIVADNASTDGSIKVMQEEFPQVRTIVLEKNFGFTGGYNKAFEQIDSDLFVLINSDIEVTYGWLEPLVRWMQEHPECGACAPKLHSWQDRDMFEYAGAAGGCLDLFGYPFCRGRILKTLETDHGQYDSPADVFWATERLCKDFFFIFKEGKRFCSYNVTAIFTFPIACFLFTICKATFSNTANV